MKCEGWRRGKWRGKKEWVGEAEGNLTNLSYCQLERSAQIIDVAQIQEVAEIQKIVCACGLHESS